MVVESITYVQDCGIDQLIEDLGLTNVRYGVILIGFGNVNSIVEAAKTGQKHLLH